MPNKFAMQYCVFLRQNFQIESECGPLKVSCNQCARYALPVPHPWHKEAGFINRGFIKRILL